MKLNKAILFSYGKYLATSFATALLISYENNHKLSANDVKLAGISVVVSTLPVIRNYFNKNYPVYGKVVDLIVSDVAKSKKA